MKRKIINWWVWTARPFLYNPITTIRLYFATFEVDEDEMEHLTPAERKALR